MGLLELLTALTAIGSKIYTNYKGEQDKEKQEQYVENERLGKIEEGRKQSIARALNYDSSKTRYPREPAPVPGTSNTAFAESLGGVAQSASALPWGKWKEKYGTY